MILQRFVSLMTPAVIGEYHPKEHDNANGPSSFERSIKEADRRRRRKRWLKIGLASSLTAIGLLTLLAGFLMHILIIPLVVESNINDNSQLINNSVLMQKWTKPAYKMQFKIYAYSIKNPDEFMGGSKPDMAVSGPYTFDKKIENRVLSTGYGKVKFRKYETYHFNEKDSCQTCILGNRIWVPNMIYQKFVEASSTTGMRAAATTLLSQTAFLEVEVDELLFEGYKDPFMDKVCEIPFMNFVCESILDVPDRIGLFYEANNTGSRIYEIRDGTDDPQNLGKLVSYDGEKLLDESWWSSDDARQLRGTDGSLFPPFLKKEEKLWIFVKELCRSIWLVYKEEVMVKGVRAYRFVVPPEVFDPEYQGNGGFCNPTEKVFFKSQNDTECWPKGLLEISKCQRSQPPIAVSLPNFLFSTDEVKNSVKGLNASDEANDGIVVDIEPRLGAVLSAKKRSQVNIEMWKGKDIAFPVNLKNMKSTLIPVIQIHEEIEVDDDSLKMIKTELYETENRAYNIATIMSIIGTILLILGLVALWAVCMKCGPCWGNRGRVSPLPPYVPRNNNGGQAK